MGSYSRDGHEWESGGDDQQHPPCVRHGVGEVAVEEEHGEEAAAEAGGDGGDRLAAVHWAREFGHLW